MTLMMDHLFTKHTGKSSAPEETKLFVPDIIKATYGRGDEVYDVTSTLRIMLAEQGTDPHIPLLLLHPLELTRDHTHLFVGRGQGDACVWLYDQAEWLHEQGLW